MCGSGGLDPDYLLLINAVSEEMMQEAVREESDARLVLRGLGTMAGPSVFLLHEKEQPAGYWVEVAARLYRQCGMIRKGMKVNPMSADAMRGVVPYERSLSGTPKQKRERVRASEEAWERMQWSSSVEE